MSSSWILRAAPLFALVVACSPQRTAGANGVASAVPIASPSVPDASATAPATGARSDASPATSAGNDASPATSAGNDASPATSAGDGASPASDAEAPSTEPSFEEIAAVLFADRATPSSMALACPPSVPPEARGRCLFDERYRDDAKAARLAYELYARWRIVAGVEVAHTMNGGYRGMIRIEPALPIEAERRHLEWIVSAMDDFERFFAELDRRAPAGGGTVAPRPERFRFAPITLRFMRSVAARTPSAYAHDWTVAYNLAGSLHRSADAVRETLFHEIFHLNDRAHPPPGSEAWSFSALGAIFDAIVKKCGASTPCLAPYSPGDTLVRGGTYYSFQPGNDVREYAAELALRYYREQRAALFALPIPSARVGSARRRFKCGPPENARAWASIRDAFFGGVDVVPSCGSRASPTETVRAHRGSDPR